MIPGKPGLRGRHKHILDGKGRVAIPASFRAHFAEQGVTQFVITNGENCLDVYDPESWETHEEWADSLPSTSQEAEDYWLYYISPAQLVEIDKQGRILIPPTLREEVGLDKEVLIMAGKGKFHIWDKETWDRQNASLKGNLRHIRGHLTTEYGGPDAGKE